MGVRIARAQAYRPVEAGKGIVYGAAVKVRDACRSGDHEAVGVGLGCGLDHCHSPIVVFACLEQRHAAVHHHGRISCGILETSTCQLDGFLNKIHRSTFGHRKDRLAIHIRGV